MTILLETAQLIVSHDPFKADIIADCIYAVARLPWTARNQLQSLNCSSLEAFRHSVEVLDGRIVKENIP